MCIVCCRSVIASEELIVRLLRLVDPVFQYSNMSHVPSEFLSLDDNIFDEIRRKSTTGMSPEHLQLVTEGKHMLSLLDRRLGPQHVQMARKVPSGLTQGSNANEINEVVRLHFEIVVYGSLPLQHCFQSSDMLFELVRCYCLQVHTEQASPASHVADQAACDESSLERVQHCRRATVD